MNKTNCKFSLKKISFENSMKNFDKRNYVNIKICELINRFKNLE